MMFMKDRPESILEEEEERDEDDIIASADKRRS